MLGERGCRQAVLRGKTALREGPFRRAPCGKAKAKDAFLPLTAFVRGTGEVTAFFLSLRYTQSDVASELRSRQRTETDMGSCGEAHGFARISLGSVFSLGLSVSTLSRQGNAAWDLLCQERAAASSVGLGNLALASANAPNSGRKKRD